MEKISEVTAISFDGDGTLWDFDKVMRSSLNRVLEELEQVDSQAAARLSVDKMIRIRNRVAWDQKGITLNLEDIRLEAFRQALIEVGRPDDSLARHLNRVYFEHRFGRIELYDDTNATLNHLQNRYVVGLLSNGNNYPERFRLRNMFHFVIFSQDQGVEKPDPRMFLLAAFKANCPIKNLLHVGDSLEEDVVGAANAGAQCVWLNRPPKKKEHNINIKYEIASLTELVDLVE